MKLDANVNEVTLSGAEPAGEFRIRNSAKAFKVLSDGLYSNKIRAIIRELSCNAIDSHVEAGKEDIQFEVHLPSVLEPWFSVKDFGVGLSGDQVTTIYTTYFESTKTDSNAYIGALGLGSKSPFSYTENFTITAIKDGTKRIYSAFINEAGVPCVALMCLSLTDEENGVEVKFSVTKSSDYSSFKHEAIEIFQWFKRPPKITGVTDIEITPIKYKEKNIVPGVHIRDFEHYDTTTVALMGNIAYPLDKIPEPRMHFENLATLLQCSLVLEFEIGDLDFAASREELSYVPLTLESIRKKLQELNNNLFKHLSEKADRITNEWERAGYLTEQYRSRLYRNAVAHYVSTTKFKLFNLDGYDNSYNFELDYKKSFEDRGLDISAFAVRHKSASKLTVVQQRYVMGTDRVVKIVTIPVSQNAIFVINDLKTGCSSRARYHYSSIGDRVTVYCITSIKKQDESQADYDLLMKELHYPHRVVKASSLSKPERKKPLLTKGILELKMRTDCTQAGNENSYSWQPINEEIDEDVTYYYVAMNGFKHLNQDGTESSNDIRNIKAMIHNSGIEGLKNLRIFGVRKNRIVDLKGLDNWVWYEDKIREEVSKVTDRNIISLVATGLLDGYYDRIYNNKNVAKALDPKSSYRAFTDQFGSIPRSTGNVKQLIELCTKYGKSLQADMVKQQIEGSKKKLAIKYPLLKYLNSATDAEVIEYIKLVDQQEQNQ